LVRERLELAGGSWRLLHVFASGVRVEIVKLLLQFEMVSLSDVAEKLNAGGVKMSLPGLYKHMGILEEAGIVRKESGGIVLTEPDARKAVYLVEGRDRVERILEQLEKNVSSLLLAGEIFNKTRRLARIVEGVGPKMSTKEREHFKLLLDKCESEQVYDFLTDDEKKKVKLWRMMITFLER